MDGYAAIIDRETADFEVVDVGEKPYWSTNGPVGDECWVSVSGEDKVVVIDYDTAPDSPRSRWATTRSACGTASSPPDVLKTWH